MIASWNLLFSYFFIFFSETLRNQNKFSSIAQYHNVNKHRKIFYNFIVIIVNTYIIQVLSFDSMHVSVCIRSVYRSCKANSRLHAYFITIKGRVKSPLQLAALFNKTLNLKCNSLSICQVQFLRQSFPREIYYSPLASISFRLY